MNDSIVLPVIGIASLAAWLIVLVYAILQKIPLYHPTFVFIMYYFVGFVLRPFIINDMGMSLIWNWVGFYPTSSEMIYTAILGIIGLFSFVFTPMFIRGNLYRAALMEPLYLLPQRPALFYLTCSIVAVIGAVVSINTTGTGLESVLSYETTYLDRGGQALVGTSGYYTMFADYLIVAVASFVAAARGKAISLVPLGAFTLLRVFIGGGRSGFIAAGLLAALIFLSRARRSFPTVGIVIAAVALLVCFDVVGSNRLAFRQLIAGDITVSQVWSDYRSARSGQGFTSDFSEFDAATSTVSAVDKSDRYNWGAQYVRLIIWPIPRQLWQDKPIITDRIIFQNFGNFQVITRSIIGDTYSNFGVLSVLIGCGMISTLLSLAHRRMVKISREGTSGSAFVLAYLMLFGNLPLLYRNDFVGAAYYVLVALPAILAITYLGKAKLMPMDQYVSPPRP